MSVKRGKYQWCAHSSTTTSASKWNTLKTMTLKKDLIKSLSRCVAGRRCVRTKNAGTKTKPVISIVAMTTCVTERQGDLTWQAHCWPLCLLFCCACCNCVVFPELATHSTALDTEHWRNCTSFFDLSNEVVIRAQLLNTGQVALTQQCSASSMSGWLKPIRFKKRLDRIATGLDSTESHWHGRKKCGWPALIGDLNRINTCQHKLDPQWFQIDPNWRAIFLMSRKNCTTISANKHFLSVLLYKESHTSKLNSSCKAVKYFWLTTHCKYNIFIQRNKVTAMY